MIAKKDLDTAAELVLRVELSVTELRQAIEFGREDWNRHSQRWQESLAGKLANDKIEALEGVLDTVDEALRDTRETIGADVMDRAEIRLKNMASHAVHEAKATIAAVRQVSETINRLRKLGGE